MSDLNNYSATGRLGADSEVKYAASGSAIWKARVAVGYGYGDNKGTNWITVVSFGKRAEGLAKLDLAKGAHIGFSGELRVREFDRKDGTKGTSVEVNANDIALLGSKEGGNREPAQRQERGQQQAAPVDDFSDEVPF